MLKEFLKMGGDPSPTRLSKRVGLAIVLAAILFRGFVCFCNVEQYSADPDSYRLIAETLANTGVFRRTLKSGETIPKAYRPPLYPYVLSLFVVHGKLPFYAVAALHTFLGCITAWCTYRVARRLYGERLTSRASILAAALVIVDPVLLQQSTLVMTETMATAIASLGLWWWVRHAEWSSTIGSAVVIGVLMAAAYLCRPTFLVWAVMITACVAFADPRGPMKFKVRIGRAAAVAMVVLLAVGAWTIRNIREIGHPIWATTHGGYTLLLGNNPLFYEYLNDGGFGETWDSGPFFTAYSNRYEGDPKTNDFWFRPWSETGVIPPEVTEYADDRLSYEAARETISREPATFARSCAVRIARLWSPFPHRTAGRSWVAIVGVGIYYLALYAAVFAAVWRLGREIFSQPWWPLWALVITLTLVHAVYWSNIRMRAPAIPVLALFAAATIRRPEELDF